MPQNTMDVDSQFNQLGSTCPLSVIWICIFPGRLSIWYDIRRYNDYYIIITYMNATTFLLNIYLTIDSYYLFFSFSLLSFCMHAYLLLCNPLKKVPSFHQPMCPPTGHLCLISDELLEQKAPTLHAILEHLAEAGWDLWGREEMKNNNFPFLKLSHLKSA